MGSEIKERLINGAGSVQTDPGRNLAKLAVVERYGKNGRIGITFVRGFGLQRGAIGITVSHDHHNLVIAGADDESMATCARAAQEMQGGLVAALGREVLAQMPLPLGGLLSDERPQQPRWRTYAPCQYRSPVSTAASRKACE